jgi:hypothetical protein
MDGQRTKQSVVVMQLEADRADYLAFFFGHQKQVKGRG